MQKQKSIADKREEMFKELRNEIINLALIAASKVIEANMDTEINRHSWTNLLKKKVRPDVSHSKEICRSLLELRIKNFIRAILSRA